MSTIQEAHRAFQAADDAWSAELYLQFGKQAGDVRYTPRGIGEPGSKLRELFNEFKSTGDTWRALVREGYIYQ